MGIFIFLLMMEELRGFLAITFGFGPNKLKSRPRSMASVTGQGLGLTRPTNTSDPRSCKHHQHSPLCQLQRFLKIRFLSLRHPGRFSSPYFRHQLPQSSRLLARHLARLRSKLHKPRLRPTVTIRATIQTSSRLHQSRYCLAQRLYLRRNLEHGI